MKTSLYGRFVFGASAVLFGVIALLWHDADTWQTLRQLWHLPLGAIIGASLMTAQIAGGIGILHPRTARLASVVLSAVYLLFSLVCIPSIIAASDPFERYGGSFFQQLSLLFGTLALYAATEESPARTLKLGRLARVGLGICAISFMLSQILFLRPTASPCLRNFWVLTFENLAKPFGINIELRTVLLS